MSEETAEKPKAARAAKPKKEKPVDEKPLIEVLTKVLSGEPMPLTAKTGDAIFPAGAAGKALQQLAIDKGYIREVDDPTPEPELVPDPPGTKKKPKAKKAPPRVPHGIITDAGRDWLLSHTSPKQAMEGLLAAFHKQSEALHGTEVDIDTLQAQIGDVQSNLAEVQKNVVAQIADLTTHLERVQRGIETVVEKRQSGVSRVLDTIEAVTKQLERKDGVPSSGGGGGGTGTGTKGLDTKALAAEAETYAREFREDRGADCPLPDLYKHLEGKFDGLSIGVFHDLLRQLHSIHRLRLTGWTDTLDSIPEPELALFVSTKVMYYAHTPEGSR